MGWTNFNDRLTVILMGIISGLWVMEGIGVLTMPGEVNGALIATFTLVIQYYFRKAPPVDTKE